MASLTVKQLSDQLLERLRSQAKKRRLSLNAFVKDVLAESVGLAPGLREHRELSDLAGSWTEAEARELERNTRPFREIDEELWR